MEDPADNLDCRTAGMAVAGVVDMEAAGHILVQLVEVGRIGPDHNFAADADTADTC